MTNQEEILAQGRLAGSASEATEIEAELRAGPEGIAAVCDELADEHLLSEVLIRNRKKVVGGFMPRQAHRWEVELTEEERTALDAVEDYVRNGYQLAADTEERCHRLRHGHLPEADGEQHPRASYVARQAALETRTGSTTATAAMALAKPLLDLAERLDEEVDDEAVLSQLLTRRAAT